MNGNVLEASPVQPGPGPQPVGNPLLDPLHAAHDQAKAQFKQVSQVGGLLKATRQELDQLVALGDSVTAEDVIKGAGSLISAGADPHSITAMLANPQSPMPSGGEALAGWVAQQDQMVKQKEAQFAPANQLAQHKLGVAALHVLAGHHMNDDGASESAPAASPTPSMAPAASGEASSSQT